MKEKPTIDMTAMALFHFQLTHMSVIFLKNALKKKMFSPEVDDGILTEVNDITK